LSEQPRNAHGLAGASSELIRPLTGGGRNECLAAN